jgi:hypothetical protein
MVQSPNRVFPLDTNVSALIDEERSWWKTSLVHGIFLREEAKIICNMVLSPGRHEDVRI